MPTDSSFTSGAVRDLDQIASWPTEQLCETALAPLLGLESQRAAANLAPINLGPINAEQYEAVKSSMDHPLTVVTGPPGTGKSQAIVAMAASALQAGQTVLVASKNHQALDAVEERLTAIATDVKFLVRTLDPAKEVDASMKDVLSEIVNDVSVASGVGLVKTAPFIELPGAPAPKERYLTRQEVGKLLDADAEPHIRLAILLMLTTAARVTAVLERTWDRVDFVRRQINLRTGQGSRKGRAIVPMNNTIHDALQQARQAALSDHVTEWAAKPVKSIKRGFARAVRDAGLNDVSPHVLRHTAAVHMAEAGISMDEISQYLGHSETRITAAVYARYSPSHLMRAARALEFGKQ